MTNQQIKNLEINAAELAFIMGFNRDHALYLIEQACSAPGQPEYRRSVRLPVKVLEKHTRLNITKAVAEIEKNYLKFTNRRFYILNDLTCIARGGFGRRYAALRLILPPEKIAEIIQTWQQKKAQLQAQLTLAL